MVVIAMTMTTLAQIDVEMEVALAAPEPLLAPHMVVAVVMVEEVVVTAVATVVVVTGMVAAVEEIGMEVVVLVQTYQSTGGKRWN